ncbi:MAG: hypothetical protein P0121_09370 [Nitrospira sp.]|nr:hypothetical protein [Nitrospira sp.]
MRLGLSQDQQQVPRSASEVMPPSANSPTTKEIPYDYVAKFTLRGERGHRVQDVINISIEGAFIATAIGYSFIPKLPDFPSTPIKVDGGTPISLLTSGSTVSLTDVLADAIAAELSTRTGANKNDIALHVASTILPCLLIRLCGIHFRYSIVDSGSGRELQNQPIHNIAGLGEATGERPFRPLAKPMLFMPRSTIRIEVEEISEGPHYAGAELQIVFHGYKMLGYGMGLS